MIKIEDDCVDCGKPCLGSSCPYKAVKHFYCDVCGDEVDPDELHDVDGVQVCDNCLIPYLEKEGIIAPVQDTTD